jgi:transglutaminase-like putative cysteine protease
VRIDGVNHPELGRVRADVVVVSDDPQRQVEQVISLMRRYAVEDSRSPVLQADLRHALSRAQPPYDEADVAAAIFDHVRGRIQFQLDSQISQVVQDGLEDPIVEALVRPLDMAGMCGRGECRLVGDCDDFAMYVAALLLAAGIPCAFVTVMADPRAPDRYSHVYVAAHLRDGRRLALDASHGQYAGWETGQGTAYREWPLTAIPARVRSWVGLLMAGLGAWWLWGRVTGRRVAA